MTEVDERTVRSEAERATATLEGADAFAIVGNPTRLDILTALWEAPPGPVTFSELRSAVGMRDSARFNYHLRKLEPWFVRQDEDGYRLRFAGKQVVSALVAGTFTEHPERGPFPAPGACVECGGALQATYREENVTVACGSCGQLHSRIGFPPGGLHGRTDAELLTAYDRRVRHDYALFRHGVCVECGGPVTTTLVYEPDAVPGYGCDDDAFPGFVAGVRLSCEQCGATVGSAVGMALLDDPDVAAFYRDHGIDLTERPYWTFPWTVSDHTTTLVGDAPVRVRVAITLDDETLAVTLDESLTVVGRERTTA